MFVALEGIDGAGKSTVAEGLCARFQSAGQPDVSLWRKSDHAIGDEWLNRRMAALRDLIWCDADSEPVLDVLGTHHYLYLHAAWFAALQARLVRPLREFPTTVAVADGWYYRTVAKAAIRGAIPISWGLSLFEHAGRPDVVVFLDVPPEVAWARRKGAFKPSEMGRWDGRTGEPYESFCTYQAEVRDLLARLAVEFSWVVVKPDPGAGKEAVLSEVYQKVNSRMGELERQRGANIPVGG